MSGPGKFIGTDGKVLTVRYGNNTRRVHVSKAVKLGREFEQKGETDDEKKAKNSAQNESETTIQREKETTDSDKGTENSNHEELEATKKKTNSSEYENDKNTESNTREKSGRLTSLRRPEQSRRIQFKRDGNPLWYEGEVLKAGSLKEKDKLLF